MTENEQTLLKSGERIDQLYSQDVQIIQSPEVFSFSLDAVLLADFVRPSRRPQLKTVDLCAGNGAIGLFLNQKIAGSVVQVELQARLADMARRSVLLNHLEARYQVLNIDLAQTFNYLAKDSVDVVVCNPPYFTNQPASKKNPNQYLAIARHELTTDLLAVVQTMSGLLKMNGHAYLVHRPDRLTEILSTMAANRLAPKRIRFVHPKQDREANMVLIEAIKDGRSGGVKVIPPLIVSTDDDQYGPEVGAMLYGNR